MAPRILNLGITSEVSNLQLACMFCTSQESCYQHCSIICVGQLSQYNVWLRTGRLGFDSRQRQSIFPLASASRPTQGVHPASCTMGKARPGRDADHSHPPTSDVKKTVVGVTRVVQGWPRLPFSFYKICLHQNDEMPSVADGGNTAVPHILRVFISEAEQTGIRLSHSECTTALYHQISGETGS
jgi:hypothetical protein